MQCEPEPQKPKNRGWIWAPAVLVVVAAIALGAAWAGVVFSSDEPAAKVAVADLTGMTEKGAADALEAVGLVVGTVTREQTDAGPAGTVVAQDPAAGDEVPEGAKVAMAVSSGASPSPPPTAAVPDVVGKSQGDATELLSAAGFTVVTAEESDLALAGEVVSQSPSAGVVAQAGSAVQITVSTGPVTPSETPPVSASP